MTKTTHTIYAIENLIDGRSYVGQTGYIDSRAKAHLLNPSARMAIGRAIIVQGKENFRVRELAYCSGNLEACLLERFYIHLLESNNPRFGYNAPRLYRVKE